MLPHSSTSLTKVLLRHGIRHPSLATMSHQMDSPILITVPLMLLVLLLSYSIISHQQCVRYPFSKSLGSSPQVFLNICHSPSRFSFQFYARFPLHELNGLNMRHS